MDSGGVAAAQHVPSSELGGKVVAPLAVHELVP